MSSNQETDRLRLTSSYGIRSQARANFALKPAKSIEDELSAMKSLLTPTQYNGNISVPQALPWSNHRVQGTWAAFPRLSLSLPPSSTGIILCFRSCIYNVTIASELPSEICCMQQSAAAIIIDHRCLLPCFIAFCARSFSFYKIQYGGRLMVPPF